MAPRACCTISGTHYRIDIFKEMAKTIYTYLHNDDLNGSRIVYMDNCFCKLFKTQRTDGDFLQIFKEDLQKPALYILLNREKGGSIHR